MRELISVIIPVYNVEPYLSDCLRSVVEQTYQKLEIILVDDGSTDASGKICDEWASRDKRIHVIHKTNGGVSSARNEGLRASTGGYIGFVDADDWIEPEMYETLAEAIEDADMAACGIYYSPLGFDIVRHLGKRYLLRCGSEEAVVCVFERDGYLTSIWNKLFRREVVFHGNQLIKMDPELAYGEDLVWLAEVLGKGQYFSFVPTPLYHYRARQGSASKTESITDQQMTLLTARKRGIQILSQNERIRSMLNAEMYDACIALQVRAYFTGDIEKYQIIRDTISPMRACWLSSKQAGGLRKARILLMDYSMRMKLPKAFVRSIYRMSRWGIKRSW